MENLSTISAKYWHALNLIIPQNLWKLWDISEFLGGPEKVWTANAANFRKTGLGAKLAARIVEKRKTLNIEDEWGKLANLGIKVLVLRQTGYPNLLGQIHSAPPIIYIRGESQILTRKGIAVVGSRKISSYGQDVVDSLVPPLASLDINIISGMAFGTDSAALEACLDHGGTPVAVLASSLVWEEISPRPNLALARRIAESGCLISENPPGTIVNKNHFPLRNRIVSGLSLGVLVIEAAERSGSCITARLALEQNREVFAVPGSIFAPNSQGTLELIKQGAKCVTSAADIAQEFGWDLGLAAAKKQSSGSPLHKIIQKLLAQEPTTCDALIRKIDYQPHEIIAGLTELEIAGSLRRSGNGVYHNVT
jgi:DNA processing protein